MRTIKFRAWDTKKKTMLYDGGDDTQPSWILHNLDYLPYSSAYELMQFTGLLDKNGKEIYEGDIVRFNSEKDNASVISYVAPCFRVGELNMPMRAMSQCEVIGNIYSNPELLK